jgi:hypothetical protein
MYIAAQFVVLCALFIPSLITAPPLPQNPYFRPVTPGDQYRLCFVMAEHATYIGTISSWWMQYMKHGRVGKTVNSIWNIFGVHHDQIGHRYLRHHLKTARFSLGRVIRTQFRWYRWTHWNYHPWSCLLNITLTLTWFVAELVENWTRVEAGSNTSTVTLRVVRGEEMGLKKGRAIA